MWHLQKYQFQVINVNKMIEVAAREGTSSDVMCESISAAVRKTSSEMVVARVSTAANPMAGNTYALLACSHKSKASYIWGQLLRVSVFMP